MNSSERLFIALLILASAVTMAAGQERFRKTPPLPESRQELELPSVERQVLQNGLSVAVASFPSQGMVTIQLIIRAGEADSPSRLPGLAAITARMVGKGTSILSADDISNLFESIGADFSASVTMEHTLIKVQVLDEFLDRALLILRQVLLEASFSEKQLTAAKWDCYYELRNKRRNGETAAMRQLIRLLFPGHPYMTATYHEDVIRFIEMDDVRSFFDRFYRPDNSIILITGDVEASSIVRKIGQHFNMWKAQPVYHQPPPPPVPNRKLRLCFMEMPALRDPTLFMGNSVPFPATDQDYFPFVVLNQILGGTTSSRLFMRLREAKGYAYYAFSETEFYMAGGLYWIRARSNKEDINNVIREVLNEMQSVTLSGFSPVEIEQAKSYLVGNFPLRIEKSEDFAGRLAAVIALDLGDAHWKKSIDNVMLVSLQRVEDAAVKYLSAPPIIVVAGRAEVLNELSREFDNIEVFDQTGSFKRILTKGDDPK